MRKIIFISVLVFIVIHLTCCFEMTYTVKWEVNGNIVETDENVAEGSIPEYNGPTPSKVIQYDPYIYQFEKWDKNLSPVTGDITYSAIFTQVKKVFTVTYLNYDGTELYKEKVNYGENPEYNSKPTKEGNEKYNYVFKGWDKNLSNITSDITCKAVFDEVLNKYNVTFLNYDGTLLHNELVEYGKLPSYKEIPNRVSTDKYSYEFKSWDKSFEAVTGDITYTATYNEIINKYSISFYDEDGITLLSMVTVEYGDNVIYPKHNPTKKSTDNYTYTFVGWVTEQDGIIKDDLSNVIKDRNVYASYKEEVKKVNVYILCNNSYGNVSINILENINCGSEITVVGNKLFINNEMIEALPIESNTQYTYEFVNWETDNTVNSNTKIIANFTRTVNKYKITWMLGDQTLDINLVEYGQTPKYIGDIPTKESVNGIEYIFSGWTPSIDIVTKDTIYYAQFSEKTQQYKVSYYDDDGVTLLGIVSVDIGKTSVYPNAIPTKPSTDKYVYTFDKWVVNLESNVEANLSSISSDMNVYAKYSLTIQKYTVTFMNYDGTKLYEEVIEYGKLPTYNEEPSREDYKFISWDKDISEVKGDITYTAIFKKIHTVTFLDYNYKILKIDYVVDGEDATAPINPSRDGYIFTTWNITFTNVKEDLYVYAEYVKQYKVVFYNQFNEVIDTVYVIENGSVTPPTLDNNETLVFIKWSENLDVITSDLKVYPVYQLKTYTVTFKMPNGDIISTQTIEHGFNAITPKCPEYYYNVNDKSVKLFTGFDKTFNSITNDLVINIIYDNPINSGYVVFDNKVNGDLITTDIYLILPNNTYIYGLEFNLVLDNNIYINTVTENKNSVLLANSNKLYYNYSNKENTFNISWSDANGNNCGSVKLLSVSSQLNNYNNSFVSTFTDSSIINLLISNKNNTSIDNVTKVNAIIINN